MRLFYRCLLALPLLFSLARAAWAQDTAPSEFRFEHLTVNDENDVEGGKVYSKSKVRLENIIIEKVREDRF